MMHFGRMGLLYFLAGVPVIFLFLFWAAHRRQKVLQKFVQKSLLPEVAKNFDTEKIQIKMFVLVLVFIFSVIALARPQWGFEWQEIKRKGLDILIVVDTSRSMLTQDVKPNRLERAKFAVKDFIKKLQGDRIGLIAFAGKSFLVCPLTNDYNGFLLSLEDLDTKTIPRGGTNLTSAIKEAMKEYDQVPSKYKAVIVLTDGDNLEGDPLSMAEKARRLGIKIYCIGIGTKEGELIQVPNDKGGTEFLKDRNGNFVKSRLNEELLQKIALETGGVYVRASGVQFGLDLIYDRELSKFEKRDIKSKREKKYFERFQIPLAFALFLLVVETCLTTRKKKTEE